MNREELQKQFDELEVNNDTRYRKIEWREDSMDQIGLAKLTNDKRYYSVVLFPTKNTAQIRLVPVDPITFMSGEFITESYWNGQFFFAVNLCK